MTNGGLTKENWKLEKLGKLCTVIMGQSPSSNTYNTEQQGLPFFQGKAEFTDLHPVVRKWCSEPNKIAEANDILLSVRAPVGTVNIADRKCCIGRGLAAIRYKNFKYIYYFLQSIEQNLDAKGTGSTFRAISGEIVKNIDVPLPTDDNIQQLIVSKLEELFSKLDNGVAGLKAVQQQLKVYRQAVLKWAFEGRLTNDNVKDGELPKGWKWVKLGSVIEDPKYGTSKKCNYEVKGHAVIRIPNIIDGYIDASDLKYAVFDNSEIESYRLQAGDILIIRSNGSVDIVGKSALATQKDESYLYAGYLIRLRVLPNMIHPNFLQNLLGSSSLRTQIEEKAKSTSGVNNINSNEIKSLIIPLPPPLEQEQIIQEIESRLSVCDKIEETITTSLKEAEALRQSILKQAFEGKLV